MTPSAEIVVPPVTDSRVQRRVKRLDARRLAQWPLFATAPAVLDQLAPAPTAEEVRAELERMAQGAVRAARERAEFAIGRRDAYRTILARYITEDQLQHMEEYIARTYPGDPLYAADYWHTLLGRLGVLP